MVRPVRNDISSRSSKRQNQKKAQGSKRKSPVQTAPTAPPSPVSAPTAPDGQQQQSTLKDMAATAAGVAVGSAVGHAVGAGITNMMSGPTAPQISGEQNDLNKILEGPCACAIAKFLKCAQCENDLNVCAGYHVELRECMTRNSPPQNSPQ